MPLVSAIRTADAGNTRAVANLAIATAWSGVAVYVGAGRARFDIILSAIQQGTISFLAGSSQADVNASTPGALVGDTTVQSWNVPAALAGFLFPWGFPTGSAWAKIYYLQGAVAGNVAIGTTLDPRPVSRGTPLHVDTFTALAAAGNVVFSVPPGAREYNIEMRRDLGGIVNNANDCRQRNAAAATVQENRPSFYYGGFGRVSVNLARAPVDLRIGNNEVDATSGEVRWFAG